MSVRLVVAAGPHAGKEFAFDGHDTFLVGRSKDAHFQLSYDDPHFSRRHFLVEVNPPRCRVIDLNSRNGTHVNGRRIQAQELADGDEVRAGHTVFKVHVPPPDPDEQPTIGLTAPPPAPTIDHAPVPGYQFDAEIGRGAMGVVYKARRTSDGEVVAVKVITPAAGVSERQTKKFVREAHVLATLDHPNILRFRDSGDAAAIIYLVTEFVDGPDLRRVVGQGQLAVRSAVRIACAVLRALAYAHEKGFVHRDVKPANILLGGPPDKRVVKLADFGLAKAFDDCRLSGLTFQGEVGGTPAFMAPEQVSHYRQVKPPADQYAVAATLYNLLTGRYTHDFETGTDRQLTQIITDPPVPIAERRADLPAGFAAVLHKALSREPDERYPDVAGFRCALLTFGK